MNLLRIPHQARVATLPPRAWRDALAQALTAEYGRWILWLPVALGVGVAFYFSLDNEPPRGLGPALVAATLGAIILAGRRRRAVPATLGLFALVLGFAAAQWRAHDVAAPVLERELRHRLVSGEVVSVEPQEGRLRIILDGVAITGLQPAATPRRVRISATAGQYGGVQPGQLVQVRATLRPPPEPAIPGGFDFRRTAWFAGLGGVGFATGDFALALGGDIAQRGLLASLADRIQGARLAIAERLRANLPGVSGAVAAALMVGERGAIPDGVREAMQQSGLAHLLAISGLHVGLVAGFVFFAVRGAFAASPRIALRQPVKKWAAVAALAMAGIYLLLAGATVPTQRAFVMTGLILVAVLVDRRGISMRLVAWAAAIILLLRPEALLSASFQMSFAAVIALIAVYEVVGEGYRRRLAEGGVVRRVALYFAGVLLTTLVASLATAPFAVFHFNRFAVYSIFANLIAIPIAAFWVMPLIVVSLLLLPLGLDGVVAPALGLGIDLIIAVAEWVAAWPGASLAVVAPPLWGLILVVVGGLWLTLWRTRWRLAGTAPIAAGLLSLAAAVPPNLLVSPDGRLTGVLTDERLLLLSDGRGQAFVREQWLRRTGALDWRAYPEPGEGARAGMQCDRLGCLYRDGDRTIAFVDNGAALAEDCRVADIVVARFTVPRACTGPTLVIDRRALRAGGSHAIAWPTRDGAAGFEVRTADGGSGRRLWQGSGQAQ